MTIPTSKILKASKAIMAVADLRIYSPETTTSQNVNIVVNTQTPDKKVAYPEMNGKVPDVNQDEQNINPYSDLPNNPQIATRDIENAMKKTEELSESMEEKENVIKALSLIIDIIQNNPLIVNKYVVAELETLSELIRLLTNAEVVEIDVDDIECSCSAPKYRIIKRIYVKKDGELYGIYQCPAITRLFDNYKISLNLVI